MIYSVNLMDLAEKINPLAFSRYLKDTGWVQFQSKRTNVRIFQLEQGNNFFQIVIPTDKGLSDYKQAMYKAVETLATAEQKAVEQVMLYLLNPNTDILKIRLSNDNVDNLMTGSTYLNSVNFYETLNGLNFGSEGTALEFTAELKERKNTSTTIIGRIRKLESSPDLEKRTNGKITVVYLD